MGTGYFPSAQEKSEPHLRLGIGQVFRLHRRLLRGQQAHPLRARRRRVALLQGLLPRARLLPPQCRGAQHRHGALGGHRPRCRRGDRQRAQDRLV